MASGVISGSLMLAKGMVDTELVAWTAVAVPALFLGSWIGNLGFRKTSARHHRGVALAVLTGLAASLIIRSLEAW